MSPDSRPSYPDKRAQWPELSEVPSLLAGAAALSARLKPSLDLWIARYGLGRKISTDSLALTMAAACPFGGLESLVLMAKAGLFVVLLDDLLDDWSVPSVEIERRALECLAALQRSSPSAPAGSAESRALGDLRIELEACRLFECLHLEWDEAFQRMIGGMLFERRICRREKDRHTANKPSFAEYMEHGKYSIGIPAYAITGAVVLGDESIVLRLAEFRELSEAAGYCVRLANDLASRSREKREMKTNAIDVKLAGATDSGAEAKLEAVENCLREEIGSGLELCRTLASKVNSRSGQPEEFVLRLAGIACYFYGIDDY